MGGLTKLDAVCDSAQNVVIASGWHSPDEAPWYTATIPANRVRGRYTLAHILTSPVIYISQKRLANSFSDRPGIATP
jgi:hypothetical protein